MGMIQEFKIGDTVQYWVAEDKKNRVIGKVVDTALAGDLNEAGEDTGEDDNTWLIKVKLKNGETTDWNNEYYFHKV